MQEFLEWVILICGAVISATLAVGLVIILIAFIRDEWGF